MEEKNMRELSMDEMDKVSGGADYKRGSKVHRFPALQPIPRQFMFRQLLGERALHCK